MDDEKFRQVAAVGLRFLDGCSFTWGDLPAMQAVRDMMTQIATGQLKFEEPPKPSTSKKA